MKNHLLILQSLKKVRTHVEYNIYGPIKDNAYWSSCEELISTMPSNISVNYKGEIIPSKVQDALNEAHVFIMPSKSENFGHAMFEAMTAGKPIITSHHTPWNNLKENLAGINVSTENIDEITSAIDFFSSMSNETLITWSKSAREYALNAVDINVIKDDYIRMFSSTNMYSGTVKYSNKITMS